MNNNIITLTGDRLAFFKEHSTLVNIMDEDPVIFDKSQFMMPDHYWQGMRFLLLETDISTEAAKAELAQKLAKGFRFLSTLYITGQTIDEIAAARQQREDEDAFFSLMRNSRLNPTEFQESFDYIGLKGGRRKKSRRQARKTRKSKKTV